MHVWKPSALVKCAALVAAAAHTWDSDELTTVSATADLYDWNQQHRHRRKHRLHRSPCHYFSSFILAFVIVISAVVLSKLHTTCQKVSAADAQPARHPVGNPAQPLVCSALTDTHICIYIDMWSDVCVYISRGILRGSFACCKWNIGQRWPRVIIANH